MIRYIIYLLIYLFMCCIYLFIDLFIYIYVCMYVCIHTYKYYSIRSSLAGSPYKLGPRKISGNLWQCLGNMDTNWLLTAPQPERTWRCQGSFSCSSYSAYSSCQDSSVGLLQSSAFHGRPMANASCWSFLWCPRVRDVGLYSSSSYSYFITTNQS